MKSVEELEARVRELENIIEHLALARRVTKTFAEAWALKESQGYQYGKEALEQVKFGWELAQGHVRELEDTIEEMRSIETTLIPEERAVLDAMAETDIETFPSRNGQRRRIMFELQEDAVCRAELARREAK